MVGPLRHEITQRDLRNDSGAIMRGVERGESYSITRTGTPIGRLIPVRRRTYTPREQVMVTFATAAVVDSDRLRADLDAAVAEDLVGCASTDQEGLGPSLMGPSPVPAGANGPDHDGRG
jgi:prevent-host-death family protein